MLRAAAAIVVIGLLLAVVFSPRLGDSTVLLRAVHDFAHAPIFGAVALASLFALRAHERFAVQPIVRQYVLVFLLSLGLGLVTEIAQLFTGRDASWSDLRTDGLGAAAFLIAASAFDRVRARVARAERLLLVLLALCVFAASAAPVLRIAVAYWYRAQAFPTIVEFKRGSAALFVLTRAAHADIVAVPDEWSVRPGERALRVQLRGEQWPTVELAEVAPDWRHYRQLTLELINPQSSELTLSIRIDDRQHNKRYEDRYNGRVLLAPRARTTIRIPLEEIAAGPRERKLDLANVARLLLFKPSAAGETIYLVRVWLE